MSFDIGISKEKIAEARLYQEGREKGHREGYREGCNAGLLAAAKIVESMTPPTHMHDNLVCALEFGKRIATAIKQLAEIQG